MIAAQSLISLFRQALAEAVLRQAMDLAALSAQPGVTVTDNMDGTVTVSPAGTRKDLVPVPAGVGIAEE